MPVEFNRFLSCPIKGYHWVLLRNNISAVQIFFASLFPKVYISIVATVLKNGSFSSIYLKYLRIYEQMFINVDSLFSNMKR